MKSATCFLRAALCSLAVSVFAKDAPAPDAPAENAPAPNLGDCVIVLEVYALDRNTARDLIESIHGDQARYERVRDLQKTGKARLDILSAVTTRSGQRAVVESNDSVRFPTDFAAPAVEGGPAIPATIEERSVGDALEVELVIGPDNRTCDLSLVPRRTSLLGFRDLGGMAGDRSVGQPLFATQKITANTTLTANKAHYLGTFSVATRDGLAVGREESEISLAFVRANLVGPIVEKVNAPFGNVDLEYSCYSVDRSVARDVLTEMNGLDAPWARIEALLAEKKARFEHMVTLQTKSGVRAVNEEIQEVRYATRFASDNGSPSAFETRNVGVTIEVEPVLGPDGVTIDLSNAVQIVSHRGDLRATGAAEKYPPEPVFETRRITNNLNTIAGMHAFVGTANPPGANGVNERPDDGRTWFLFVRAVVREP
jgi:hypothetical protein